MRRPERRGASRGFESRLASARRQPNRLGGVFVSVFFRGFVLRKYAHRLRELGLLRLFLFARLDRLGGFAQRREGVARGTGHDRDAADARDDPRGARDVREHGGGGADGGFLVPGFFFLFLFLFLLRKERRR